MVDGLERLRHHAVICCDDDDDDVRDLGAARTHAGEGLMARCIEEDDLAAEGGRVRLGDVDLVRADVLRDAAGFASRHVRRTDRVEQRGLTVIDVAHDGDDRRARDLDQAGGVFEQAFDGFILHLLFDRENDGVRTELARNILRQLAVERLVHGDEDAAHQQRGDEVLAAHFELLGEVLDADAFGDGDRPRDGQRLGGDHGPAVTRRRLEALHRAFLALLVTLATAALAGA